MLSPRQAWKAPPGMLRHFAGLWLCLFGYLAYRHGIVLEQPLVGGILLAVGAVVAVVGLMQPLTIRPLFVGLLYLTYPVGLVLSCLILVTLYYGLFTPLGVVRRWLGADPLRLRRPTNQTSYWDKRPAVPEPKSYFRQW